MGLCLGDLKKKYFYCLVPKQRRFVKPLLPHLQNITVSDCNAIEDAVEKTKKKKKCNVAALVGVNLL